jgi:Family of unknown function (DUF6196)
MDITPETPEQTQARLLRVIADARMHVEAGEFAFAEVPQDQFPSQWIAHSKAFVRDEHVWSALVPASLAPGASDKFVLLCFHFDANIPNSGFVGWLATVFKQRLGTGVMVVCGQNSGDGGIFDYWGLPASIAKEAIAVVEELRKQGSTAT